MHRLVGQVAFYALLLRIDEDLAENAWRGMCPLCGSVLHKANYPRVLCGAPPGLPGGFEKCFSFCCKAVASGSRPPACVSSGAAGTRLRSWCWSPPSNTPQRLVGLMRSKWLERPVPRSTLERWRRWWRETFTASPFWQGLRGRFAKPVAESRLPLSLIEEFSGDDATRLVATLKLLTPTTTASGAHLAMGPARR